MYVTRSVEHIRVYSVCYYSLCILKYVTRVAIEMHNSNSNQDSIH